MASMGNSLDGVKIVKSKDVITIIETYVIQEYNGLGYESSKQAALTVSTAVVVHNKKNLQIAIKDGSLTIRSTAGAMHTIAYDIIETEGISKSDDMVQFAQNLMS